MNATAFLKNLLLDFYERTSLDDLLIRHTWSRNIFSKNQLNQLEMLNECLSTEVNSLRPLFVKNSALDVPLNLIEPSTLVNNLSIVLYFRLIIFNCQAEEDFQRNKNVIYLKEYSSAVCLGKFKKRHCNINRTTGVTQR